MLTLAASHMCARVIFNLALGSMAATRLQSILSRVGLSPSSLSDPARAHLSTLASLAQLLALKNVEPAT